jgi:CRISPR-associated protein Cas1
MSLLVVDEFGCYVGKHGELVRVRKEGETLAECPFEDITCINIEGRGVSLSVDLIHECALRGITINCVDFDGEPYAKLMSPMLTATVETRREQLMAFEDARGVDIARAIVAAKLANQRGLLLYSAKYRRKTQPELGDQLTTAAAAIAALRTQLDAVAAPRIDDCRAAILNLEGRAAATYWQAFWQLLPEGLAPDKREHQGASDPVNALLNYGYGILYSQCWSAVLLAGLDPFGGFIHVDRPGKPSLVLDLQEVFRQPVVDRVVLAMLNKGFRPTFEEDGRIAKDARRHYAAQVLDRLNTLADFDGKRNTLQSFLVQQARALAVAVRGEKPLKPYVMRW